MGFPEPIITFSIGKLWRREDILRWHAQRYGGNLDAQIKRHRAILEALEAEARRDNE